MELLVDKSVGLVVRAAEGCAGQPQFLTSVSAATGECSGQIILPFGGQRFAASDISGFLGKPPPLPGGVTTFIDKVRHGPNWGERAGCTRGEQGPPKGDVDPTQAKSSLG